MRFMVIVKADRKSEAGVLPDEKLLAGMGNYNEELATAGVLVSGEGLHPSAKGARVRFYGASRTVVNGPFPQTQEVVADFFIFQEKPKQEAMRSRERRPNP